MKVEMEWWEELAKFGPTSLLSAGLGSSAATEAGHDPSSSSTIASTFATLDGATLDGRSSAPVAAPSSSATQLAQQHVCRLAERPGVGSLTPPTSLLGRRIADLCLLACTCLQARNPSRECEPSRPEDIEVSTCAELANADSQSAYPLTISMTQSDTESISSASSSIAGHATSAAMVGLNGSTRRRFLIFVLGHAR